MDHLHGHRDIVGPAGAERRAAAVCFKLRHTCTDHVALLPKRSVVYLPQGHLEHLGVTHDLIGLFRLSWKQSFYRQQLIQFALLICFLGVREAAARRIDGGTGGDDAVKQRSRRGTEE